MKKPVAYPYALRIRFVFAAETHAVMSGLDDKSVFGGVVSGCPFEQVGGEDFECLFESVQHLEESLSSTWELLRGYADKDRAERVELLDDAQIVVPKPVLQLYLERARSLKTRDL